MGGCLVFNFGEQYEIATVMGVIAVAGDGHLVPCIVLAYCK